MPIDFSCDVLEVFSGLLSRFWYRVRGKYTLSHQNRSEAVLMRFRGISIILAMVISLGSEYCMPVQVQRHHRHPETTQGAKGYTWVTPKFGWDVF